MFRCRCERSSVHHPGDRDGFGRIHPDSWPCCGLHQMSALLRGRRHDIQTGKESTPETYEAESGKVSGFDALPSTTTASA